MAKVKYLMLLPLTYNDGSRVPKAVHNAIFDKLFEFADGYTIGGAAKGAYRMKSGEKQIDHSLQVWIGIDESQADGLVELVSDFCALLKQESMYLECTRGSIDFVPPNVKGGQ